MKINRLPRIKGYWGFAVEGGPGWGAVRFLFWEVDFIWREQ